MKNEADTPDMDIILISNKCLVTNDRHCHNLQLSILKAFDSSCRKLEITNSQESPRGHLLPGTSGSFIGHRPSAFALSHYFLLLLRPCRRQLKLYKKFNKSALFRLIHY